MSRLACGEKIAQARCVAGSGVGTGVSFASAFFWSAALGSAWSNWKLAS